MAERRAGGSDLDLRPCRTQRKGQGLERVRWFSSPSNDVSERRQPLLYPGEVDLVGETVTQMLKLCVCRGIRHQQTVSVPRAQPPHDATTCNGAVNHRHNVGQLPLKDAAWATAKRVRPRRFAGKRHCWPGTFLAGRRRGGWETPVMRTDRQRVQGVVK